MKSKQKQFREHYDFYFLHWSKFNGEHHKKFQISLIIKFQRKGNSNFELGMYLNAENYFLTIIKHIAVPSSKLEFPFILTNLSK